MVNQSQENLETLKVTHPCTQHDDPTGDIACTLFHLARPFRFVTKPTWLAWPWHIFLALPGSLVRDWVCQIHLLDCNFLNPKP